MSSIRPVSGNSVEVPKFANTVATLSYEPTASVPVPSASPLMYRATAPAAVQVAATCVQVFVAITPDEKLISDPCHHASLRVASDFRRSAHRPAPPAYCEIRPAPDASLVTCTHAERLTGPITPVGMIADAACTRSFDPSKSSEPQPPGRPRGPTQSVPGSMFVSVPSYRPHKSNQRNALRPSPGRHNHQPVNPRLS